jgi:serine/threonine protein kinase
MADNEYTLFKCIAEEELVIPHLRLRPSKPNRILDHHLSAEELEDYETEPVDEDLRDLIKRLLTKNPAKRILLKEVKRHPWVLCGLRDPIEWVERTDPERSSYGHKIEVTVEDVETAVSTPGIVHKLRKVAGRAGSWLRKRGSSTTTTSKDSKQDLKERPVARGCDAPGDARSKQGQPSFLRYSSSDPDQELQWLGGVRDSREEEKLNPLAPSATNSSAGSSETVHGHQTETIEKDGEHEQWFSGPSGGLQHRASSDKKLRRKRSMALLGGNLLKRRSSHTPEPARPARETHRGPIDASPGSPMHDLPAHIAESIAALAAPALSRKIAQSPKNNDLVRAGGLSRRSSTYGGHREILAEAPYSRNNESDQDTLPTYTPEPRSLYTVINNMENGTLNISPKSTDTTTLKERIERQRREELEQARRRLGKIDIYDDILAQPCPSSPDDEIPPERTHDQQRQAMMLVEKERERHSSPRSTRSADGWIRESVYHPFRELATPPMAMAPNSRNSEHSPPASPQNSPCAPLRSSSGDEKSASTTAGSSLTNSASFPSTVTNPSSVSSDFFHHQYSHKGSLVPAEDVLSMDDDDRLRLMQAQNRERKTSELLFLPEEDSGSDSEGGFVMKSRASKRTRGVTVDDLARRNERLKDASHVRQHSRSSGGTVTDKDACEHGTEEQT